MSDVFDPEAVDEAVRQRFELAWLAREPRTIESFFPQPVAERDRHTVEELVLIEMEFAWKQWAARESGAAPPNSPETYIKRFPLLDRAPCRRRLIEHEAQLRERFEAPPTLAAFVEQTSGAPSQFQQGAAVDRLQLHEPIGRGSFGVIWR